MSREGSPYAAVYARADALAARAEGMSGTPADVVRAMRHAIVARRPRTRYVMPFQVRVGMFLLARLPTRARDALLAMAAGLTRARLLPAATS